MSDRTSSDLEGRKTYNVACETRWMTSLLDDESRFHLSRRAMSLTMASPASVQMA